MEKIEKELVDEILSHCDSIIDNTERMTSGNFMHNKNANKFSAKMIKKCISLLFG